MLDMPQLPAPEIIGLARAFSFYTKWPKEKYPEIRETEPQDEAGNRKYEAMLKAYQQEQFGAATPIEA